MSYGGVQFEVEDMLEMFKVIYFNHFNNIFWKKIDGINVEEIFS